MDWLTVAPLLYGRGTAAVGSWLLNVDSALHLAKKICYYVRYCGSEFG